MTPLPAAQLLGRIPHAAPMFLLDTVERWDDVHIVCGASGHRDPAHPMRAAGRLGCACAVEYAAQAMAAHGALLMSERAPPRAGFLVALRELELARERLDDLPGDLRIEVRRSLGDDTRVIYDFAVTSDALPVARGRATVVLDVAVAP